MALKDHPIIFVFAACAATAASTWTVSEQLRVVPLKARLEAQVVLHKLAPEIKSVVITRIMEGNSELAEQTIQFSDPDGDAVFVNYIVLGTNARSLTVTSSAIEIPKEEQIRSSTTVGRWECGTGSYFVKFRAVITDRSGNTSLPYDYIINCNQ